MRPAARPIPAQPPTPERTIAAALALSQKTVQNYHSAIKAKLQVQTDANLVWIAISAGLLASGGAPEPAVP